MTWWMWPIAGYLGIGVVIWVGLTAMLALIYLRTPIPFKEQVAAPRAPMAKTLKGISKFIGVWGLVILVWIVAAVAIAILWGVAAVVLLLDETLWKEESLRLAAMQAGD